MGWRRFFRRSWWDDERSRELESYLELETEENVARGMPPAEARAAARRKLGNTGRIRGRDLRHEHRDPDRLAAAGHPLRRARVAPQSGLHHRCRADARLGDRRRHRRLQRAAQHPARPVPVCEFGTDGQRVRHQRRERRAPARWRDGTGRGCRFLRAADGVRRGGRQRHRQRPDAHLRRVRHRHGHRDDGEHLPVSRRPAVEGPCLHRRTTRCPARHQSSSWTTRRGSRSSAATTTSSGRSSPWPTRRGRSSA